LASRLITPKSAIAAALLVAAIGFIVSELIERVYGLVPCELCLIQRWSVFGSALFLGLCWWVSQRWLWVSGFAATTLATLVGLAAAWRHVWLQTHPGEPLGCLPNLFGRSVNAAAAVPGPTSDLSALANPLQSLRPAPSACSVPQAGVLGFTVADWSLVHAVILVSLVVLAFVLAVHARPRTEANVSSHQAGD
jgi:disulfide bond formation protein DsbB